MRTRHETAPPDDGGRRYAERWLRGIPYEVAFWRSYYGSRRRRRELFSWSGFGKECALDGFDVQGYVAALPHPSPVVVDLGCALSYAMGDRFPARPDARVDYVDPLAPFYNRILARYGIDRPAIRFGMIENISASYLPGSVDLVHVRNALDHCADPMRGIIEALACLRVGGVLYLNHFRDEAEREGYRGFHQWNIDLRGGALTLWNREETVDVAARLGGRASVETSVTPQGRIVAVIRKTGELPLELHDPAESALRASRMLMAAVGHFHSLPRSASYQFARLYTTLGHRLMRLLPYSLMNRLKALLGK
ncbi:MAG: class I SAM-dependent methyltransferase [Muribaculaceae bacterium]|nr:class I SAM-dependent methyltransferase [Muribaculaceae bacterium]